MHIGDIDDNGHATIDCTDDERATILNGWLRSVFSTPVFEGYVKHGNLERAIELQGWNPPEWCKARMSPESLEILAETHSITDAAFNEAVNYIIAVGAGLLKD